MNEVWVTGLGAVTAVGNDTSSLTEALARGRSGIRPRAELDGYPAAAVATGGSEAASDPRDRRLERSAALFRQAADRAWQHAGLSDASIAPGRIGVCDGSSTGPMAELLDRALRRGADERARVRPSAIVQLMPGAGGAAFAQQHDVEGPVLHVNAGSVAAAAAIGEAYLWVRSGRVDVAIAGGAEAPLQEDIFRHFQAAGVLPESPDPKAPCRPFDATRDGAIFGEGGGALVLESAEHARRRAAEPIGILGGYGLTAERYSMMAPDPAGGGVARAARMALEGLCGRVGWVKAHGSGTRLGDEAELRGLGRVLGDELSRTPVTGLKPIVGHCLGASAAVEAVMTLIALREGLVPPTVGTRALDPALPRCELVTEPRAALSGDVLLLAEGFGGRAGALRLGLPR